MSPEVKATATYFLICVLIGCGMIIQGINLKNTNLDTAKRSASSSKTTGQFLIIAGVFIIALQLYELIQKVL